MKFSDREGTCLPLVKWVDYLSEIVIFSYIISVIFQHNVCIYSPGQLPSVTLT